MEAVYSSIRSVGLNKWGTMAKQLHLRDFIRYLEMARAYLVKYSFRLEHGALGLSLAEAFALTALPAGTEAAKWADKQADPDTRSVESDWPPFMQERRREGERAFRKYLPHVDTTKTVSLDALLAELKLQE